MNQNSVTARVIEAEKSSYIVKDETGEKKAILSGKLIGSREFPVVGDYVTVREADRNTCLIMSIGERKSFISRPDRSGHADGFVKTMREQPMVANIDRVLITVSLNMNFNVNRITRYASIVANGGCRPIVVLTKADLCEDREPYVNKVREILPELPVVCLSSVTGEGIDELFGYFREGESIALMGSSGVGKSTLLNALAGRELSKTSAIREEDGKGRHTTTRRQLFEVNGVFFLDTPGMRELGMCAVSEGIDETFPDVTELLSRCRFSDCRHETEPGCAVKAALQDGSLNPDRWALYLSLKKESGWASGLRREKGMKPLKAWKKRK